MNNQIVIIRKQVEFRKGQLAQIHKSIETTEGSLRDDGRRLSQHERALEIVKAVGLATQKQLEYHLAEQVSLAMDAVFDNPYSLAIHFGEKRGKTEAELMFVRGELEMPPIGSAGGGAIDVASLALRIAYWSMRQDSKVSSVLLLDEPFSQLKGETANLRALQLIQELSHTLGIQVIMISDERVSREDIIDNADKVFYVSQKKGVSNVRVIE